MFTIKDKNWEMVIEDSVIVEYDNYSTGFEPFSYNRLKINTVRVFISINKLKRSVSVLMFPWREGETYTAGEMVIPVETREKIKTLVKETDFYKGISVICTGSFPKEGILVE